MDLGGNLHSYFQRDDQQMSSEYPSLLCVRIVPTRNRPDHMAKDRNDSMKNSVFVRMCVIHVTYDSFDDRFRRA